MRLRAEGMNNVGILFIPSAQHVGTSVSYSLGPLASCPGRSLLFKSHKTLPSSDEKWPPAPQDHLPPVGRCGDLPQLLTLLPGAPYHQALERSEVLDFTTSRESWLLP